MININNVLPEESSLSEFEKMIMKWTAYDHFCPAVKAEIIWDMMLSEFVVDMVAYTYKKIEPEKYPRDAFYLLAKEFPIPGGAKADYLVAFDNPQNPKDKKIIIVELKSTPGSFSDTQLGRYIICTPGDMFESYERSISKNVGHRLYQRNPLDWRGGQKYISQITYMYQQFHKATGVTVTVPEKTDTDKRGDVKRFHSAFIKKLSERYEKLDLLYLYVDKGSLSTDNPKDSRNGKDTGGMSVRMEVKILDDKEDNHLYEIYTTGANDEFAGFLGEKREQDDLDKGQAWDTFKQVMDTVVNYKKDFEETKSQYEPYNKYKTN